jgi:SAM-dependent methyltransferase
VTPRRRKEWFDDDQFWQVVFPFLFTETRFADGGQELERALALAKPIGTTALDLGCGPGRCAVPLAQRGFTVTAVDRTPYFLGKAKARARTAGVTLELVEADMRDFVRPAAFHLALSLYTSFGYFENKTDDRLVVENLFASLAPGGVCVIDVMGKETLAARFERTTSVRLPNGSLLVQRHEIVDDWTRVRNDWVVIRQGRAKNFTFNLTIYSGQELRQLLEAAGFTSVTLHGSLSGEPYGPGAERLVAVARKPA